MTVRLQSAALGRSISFEGKRKTSLKSSLHDRDLESRLVKLAALLFTVETVQGFYMVGTFSSKHC